MKQPVRMVLWVLCAVLILSAPFLISSPAMLSEVKWNLMDQMDGEDGEELDIGRLLFSSAKAEDKLIEEVTE